MNNPCLYLLGLLCSVQLLCGLPSLAAVYCVSDAGALQDRLDDAANTPEADTILLVQGAYTGNFLYLPADDDPYGISLQGGWDNGCTSQNVNPANTVLDGGMAGVVLQFNEYGAGIEGGRGDIEVIGLTLRHGSALLGGGLLGLTNPPGTITLRQCILENNTAQSVGGGCALLAGDLTGNSGSTVTIQDTIIRTNTATGYTDGATAETGEGAGCAMYATATTVITNSLIHDNRAGTSGTYNGYGGGLLIEGFAGDVHLVNTTITGNTAIALNPMTPTGNGGGLYVATAEEEEPGDTPSWAPVTVTLRNSILYGNTLNSSANDISNALIASGATAGTRLDIDYCDYGLLVRQDAAVLPSVGSHNLFTSPGFSPKRPYRLTPRSPCVDAGDDLAAYVPPKDLEGLDRPQDGDGDGTPVTNMGCYEQVVPPSFPRTMFLPAFIRPPGPGD